MDPSNPFNNNSSATSRNFQQSTDPMSESTQSNPIMPMSESLKQSSAVPPSHIMKQNTQKVLRYVKVLPKICLAVGIITIVGTILAVLGFVSGSFFSSQGAAMVSSLLLGAAYGTIRQYGIILCVVTLIATFVAKNRYYIPVKKPVLFTIISIFMIYIPTIILYCISLF